MREVETFIWHDAEGKILAVGHAADQSDETVEPVAAEGQHVMRTRLPVDRLSDLHLTHAVDPKRGELVERRRAEET